MWAVLSQRVSMPRRPGSRQGWRRSSARRGDRRRGGRRVPRPRTLAALEAFPGVWASKLERIRGLAAAALAGDLDPEVLRGLDLEAALTHLESLPGIGPFSAGLILAGGAGHPDVRPATVRRLRGPSRGVRAGRGAGRVQARVAVRGLASLSVVGDVPVAERGHGLILPLHTRTCVRARAGDPPGSPRPDRRRRQRLRDRAAPRRRRARRSATGVGRASLVSRLGSLPRCWRRIRAARVTPTTTTLSCWGSTWATATSASRGRTQRLRISLDSEVRDDRANGAEALLRRCFPHRARLGAWFSTAGAGRSSCTCTAPHMSCLFPQHGPGKKHSRRITLEDWQQTIVAAGPRGPSSVAASVPTAACFVNRTGPYEYLELRLRQPLVGHPRPRRESDMPQHRCLRPRRYARASPASTAARTWARLLDHVGVKS